MKPHFTIATQLALAGLCVALTLEAIQFNSVALAVATVKTLVRQNLVFVGQAVGPQLVAWRSETR
jgi:Na+-translocating ferredoxin:NAD+ oxidoreductase RnfE subunit